MWYSTNIGMNLITDNLTRKEGTFYEKLSEEGEFDQALFAELILFIDSLNQSDLSKLKRSAKGNEIWALAFKIASSLRYHFNENDAFEIANVNNDKLTEIGQVLEYICTSFVDNEQLDMDFVHEMTK